MKEVGDWLVEFERRHGRPLRVLHIGNIANNAYNNAKIQRARGIEADVLSHDYYHIMACPEWEDADFKGEIADEMFPDWWAVDLRSFRRPHWFAQGPLDACLRYLLAHVSGNPKRGTWWRALEFERWLLCRKSRASRVVHSLLQHGARRRVSYVESPANVVVGGAAARLLGAIAPKCPIPRLRRYLRWLSARTRRFAQTADLAHDVVRHRRALAKALPQLAANSAAARAGTGTIPTLREQDLEWPFLWWWHPYTRLLVSRYDIVQAYATYTTMPFILSRTDYIAYEHGTIRSIPFQDTAEGRMCALTYSAAAAVLVTNSDNLSAAEKLAISEDRIVCLPHAFDSDKLERFARSYRAPSATAEALPLFFSPTRQHWVSNDPGWAKGNDRVIRALRSMVDEGFRCRLRLVAWGADIDASKVLVDELGLRDFVEWVRPMKKRELWVEYLNADAVLDQFVVPALGGVTFEAMMLGRRTITAIDEEQTRRFFGEPPPVFNCRTADHIARAMLVVCRDQSDTAGRGALNQAWMRRYHSAERIVQLQVRAYKRVLCGGSAAT